MKQAILNKRAALLLACILGASVLLAACAPGQESAATPGKTGAATETVTEKPLLSATNAKPKPKPTPTPPPSNFTPPPAPKPGPAKVVPYFAYIDTVTTAEGQSPYGINPSLSCVKTSRFARGMRMLFRAEFVNTSTGKEVQAADVDTVVVVLPHGEELKMRYRPVGGDPSRWFWSIAWNIPPDYTLGKLDYRIVMTTKDAKKATFTDPIQVGDSVVTIVAF